MSEDQDKDKSEGLVPEQETPAKETPSAAEVPEEQATKVEKPAPPDSAKEDAVDAPPKKTDEQLQADRAYFQSEAQKAKAELEQFQVGAGKEPQPAEEVTPTASEKRITDMSDEELADFLRENPLAAMQVMDRRQEERMSRMLKGYQEEVRYEQEEARTGDVLRSFCERNKIPEKQFNEAHKYFLDLGVKSKSPAAIGRLIIDKLTSMMIENNMQEAATRAAADASQAVKQQLLTQQPAGGGQPEPAQDKTLDEKVGEKFGPSKGQKAIDALFP